MADAGFPVYLVEREPSIGGHMAQFDKTFPTLDCAACILTPQDGRGRQHPNITLLTWSEVEEVTGYVGNFTVKIRQKARYVDTDLCTGCGICQEKCPAKVVDDVFEAGIGYRKAIYTPFPQAVPRFPVIDRDNCTYFEQRQVQGLREVLPDRTPSTSTSRTRIVELEVGNIILATGFEPLRRAARRAVRLRPAAERLHEPGVRAAVQRRRPDQRQDRPARRRDRAEDGGASSTASAAATATTTPTARPSAACRA